jgi:hypothetical protein
MEKKECIRPLVLRQEITLRHYDIAHMMGEHRSYAKRVIAQNLTVRIMRKVKITETRKETQVVFSTEIVVLSVEDYEKLKSYAEQVTTSERLSKS